MVNLTAYAHYELAEVAGLVREIMPHDAEIFGNQFPAYRADPMAETLRAVEALGFDSGYAQRYAEFQRDMVYGWGWGVVLKQGDKSVPKLYWTPSRDVAKAPSAGHYQTTEDLRFQSVFSIRPGDIQIRTSCVVRSMMARRNTPGGPSFD
jgi:hypothetical protein